MSEERLFLEKDVITLLVAKTLVDDATGATSAAFSMAAPGDHYGHAAFQFFITPSGAVDALDWELLPTQDGTDADRDTVPLAAGRLAGTIENAGTSARRVTVVVNDLPGHDFKLKVRSAGSTDTYTITKVVVQRYRWSGQSALVP